MGRRQPEAKRLGADSRPTLSPKERQRAKAPLGPRVEIAMEKAHQLGIRVEMVQERDLQAHLEPRTERMMDGRALLIPRVATLAVGRLLPGEFPRWEKSHQGIKGGMEGREKVGDLPRATRQAKTANTHKERCLARTILKIQQEEQKRDQTHSEEVTTKVQSKNPGGMNRPHMDRPNGERRKRILGGILASQEDGEAAEQIVSRIEDGIGTIKASGNILMTKVVPERTLGPCRYPGRESGDPPPPGGDPQKRRPVGQKTEAGPPKRS